MTHVNLFSFGHTRRQVRDSMSGNQKRDHSILSGLDIVFVASVAFLARHLTPPDFVAMMIATISGMAGLRYFVDQSVRNFYLHRLDWDDAGPDPE